ncbi:TlpA family protein disulfide reductase [Fulvivirga ligni]|uniref:TlpA family protein disulfide reductase n=1 Tax=Fulvivirga ligni TaxID=2904246 RepID=UPI001F1AEE7F|nr:TlpA disulfide reductase family protein [Fulvivirga ligni]UII23953.1 TlpA family protein disulfide reductase [Fulvivirga ligni]
MKKKHIEWLVTVVVISVLYFTGWYKDVSSFLQRGMLQTGLFNAETEATAKVPADFNLQLRTINGDLVHLSELKGKVIFMNLWATWCPPCVAEMPGIHDLYEAYADNENVAFVMLAIKDSDTRIQNYITKKSFTFPVYTSVGTVPEVYQTGSIPSTFIISKDGYIVSTEKGMRNYDTKKYHKFLDKLIN